MQVAIIGGGVGGLAVAFNLASDWPAARGDRPLITVFEASDRFGGNGDTAQLQITPDYPRWSDLGVDDFNASTYTEIVNAMETIGFTVYAPLEDSTSYFTIDG